MNKKITLLFVFLTFLLGCYSDDEIVGEYSSDFKNESTHTQSDKSNKGISNGIEPISPSDSRFNCNTPENIPPYPLTYKRTFPFISMYRQYYFDRYTSNDQYELGNVLEQYFVYRNIPSHKINVVYEFDPDYDGDFYTVGDDYIEYSENRISITRNSYEFFQSILSYGDIYRIIFAIEEDMVEQNINPNESNAIYIEVAETLCTNPRRYVLIHFH